jgi:hypothetical protein
MSCFSRLALGILVRGYSARRMLNSVVDAWEKGKAEVQTQKESFQDPIAALYPKFVTERHLSGDRSLHCAILYQRYRMAAICIFVGCISYLFRG